MADNYQNLSWQFGRQCKNVAGMGLNGKLLQNNAQILDTGDDMITPFRLCCKVATKREGKETVQLYACTLQLILRFHGLLLKLSRLKSSAKLFYLSDFSPPSLFPHAGLTTDQKRPDLIQPQKEPGSISGLNMFIQFWRLFGCNQLA